MHWLTLTLFSTSRLFRTGNCVYWFLWRPLSYHQDNSHFKKVDHIPPDNPRSKGLPISTTLTKYSYEQRPRLVHPITLHTQPQQLMG